MNSHRGLLPFTNGRNKSSPPDFPAGCNIVPAILHLCDGVYSAEAERLPPEDCGGTYHKPEISLHALSAILCRVSSVCR